MVIIHHEGFTFRRFFKLFFIFIVALFVFSWLFGVLKEDSFLGPQTIIIPITGEISLNGATSLFGTSGLSADEIIEQIENANEDDDIIAIIFEINSPGGTVVASEDISRAIQESSKPTVAWLREIATSGGYWVAASTDSIVANPATITGSIGVIGSYLSYSNLFDEYGVKYERLVSGPYKDTGTPFKNLTEAERNLMQSKIDEINNMFIKHISESRSMEIWEVRQLATGEIFLGSEAITLGLVDHLGGKEKAVSVAEELAGVSESKIVTYKKKVSVLDRLAVLTNINIDISGSDGFIPRS